MCFKVCFVRFIQSSITLTSLDPTHKDGPNLDGKLAHMRLGCGNLKLTVYKKKLVLSSGLSEETVLFRGKAEICKNKKGLKHYRREIESITIN